MSIRTYILGFPTDSIDDENVGNGNYSKNLLSRRKPNNVAVLASGRAVWLDQADLSRYLEQEKGKLASLRNGAATKQSV